MTTESECWPRVLQEILKNIKQITTALVTRIVFVSLSMIACLTVWNTVTPWSVLYWFLPSGILGLLIETVCMIYTRKGREYKWYVLYWFLPSGIVVVLPIVLVLVSPLWNIRTPNRDCLYCTVLQTRDSLSVVLRATYPENQVALTESK